MNCDELKGVLNDFLNGNLSGEMARSVRVHLASCPRCFALLSAADRMEILPALDTDIEPSGDFAVRFRARLREPRKRSFWGFSWKIASAAAVALVAVGIFLGQYRLRTQQLPDNRKDLAIVEDLPLLQDMPVISNLNLLENFDAIEALTIEERGGK
jgi:predicted anti-sigma-YlaC factor YlaD